jgi:hypothetical protein
MPYKVLDDHDLKEMNAEYKTLAESFAAEANQAEKIKLTAKMQSKGIEVEEYLNNVARQVRAYFTQHSGKVDNWLRLSDTAIANARQAAAAYKKDTTAGVPPQLQQAVNDITLWEQAIGTDADEFGAAWFKYRVGFAAAVPAKYKAAFLALRTKVMEDQKDVTTTRTKVKGYVAEAEGLVQVAAKATMKAGIKAGTGFQRPIADARKDAKALADQMASELNLLRAPHGLAIQPGAITQAMQNARTNSKDMTFTKTTENVTSVSGRKKNVQSGIQLMRTRVASMEKLLATKTKAFRSNELSDPTVKDDVKKAKKSLKDANVDLQVSEGEAKKALDYLAVIEKRWAAR